MSFGPGFSYGIEAIKTGADVNLCPKCGSEFDGDIMLNDCFACGPGEDCDVCPHWDCCDEAADERGHDEKVEVEKS